MSDRSRSLPVLGSLLLAALLTAGAASAQARSEVAGDATAAQQEAAQPAEPQALANEGPQILADEDKTSFNEAIAEVDKSRDEIARINARLSSAEGLVAEVLATRLDREWMHVLKTALGFAEAVAAKKEAGFDVAPFEDKARALLEQLLPAVERAVDSIGGRVILPDSKLPIAEQAAIDDQFFAALQAVNDTYKELYRGMQLAGKFGLDTADERAFLEQRLSDGAGNLSIYLDIAKAEAAGLRSSVVSLPNDGELAAKLRLADARVQEIAAALQANIGLMSDLELPTARYKQQLLTVTGEITASVLDIDVLTGLLSSWGENVRDVVVEQGPQIIFKLLVFVLIVFVFVKLAALVRKGIERAMDKSGANFSQLFKAMVLSISRNLVIAIGVLVGLSQLGITLGPVLAGLGIAGFIVGFALQDSLSNFASGMMILFYRPFDVGDTIDTAGVRGKVNHMSLVNTTIRTFDNQSMIIPNNKIWQDVIVNLTDQRERRIDMTFGIAYDEDIDRVEKVVMDVIEADGRVLAEPEPVIKVGSFGDSSVQILVRPWVGTEDYWEVLWDLNKKIKQAFDREGITIPFPQRDVHIFHDQAGDVSAAADASPPLETK